MISYVFKIIFDFFKLFAGKKTVGSASKWVGDSAKSPESKPDIVEHVRAIEGPEGKFLLQDTKYDSQRDNKIDPTKTCYPTSVAMVIRTLEQPVYGGQGRAEYLNENSEDVLIRHLVDNRAKYKRVNIKRLGKWTANIFPRYIGGFWVWYINNHVPGYKAAYKYFTRNQLKAFIRKNQIPVVTSTKLSGSGGHIVVTVGFNDKGFYCNDPYGDARNYRKYPSTRPGRPTKFGIGVWYENWRMKKNIGCVVITHDK